MKEFIKRQLPPAWHNWLKRQKNLMTARKAVVMKLNHRKWKGASHDEIYGDDYFRMVERTTGQSAGILADSVVKHLQPASVIDIGCGTGNLLEHVRERGVAARGVEYSESALSYCIRRGLEVTKLNLADPSQTAQTLGEFDLAVSMEVGHQLPVSCADSYIDFICKQAGLVLFTVDDGVTDKLPLNTQSDEYWVEKFAARGFQLDERQTRVLKIEWESKGTASWFHRNPMVFRHNGWVPAIAR